MELNSLIFPAPRASYTSDSKNLIWIRGDEPKIVCEKQFQRKFSKYKIKARILQKDTGNKENEKCPNMQLDQKDILNNNIKISNNNKPMIPCLWMPFKQGCNKVLVYFHGNAEDLGFSYSFTDALRQNLQINVFAVEYMGYGAYKGKSNSNQILDDAERVYDFLTDTLGFQQKDIFLFGRSIGSGPATHLASKKKPGALFLMCPYTSIRSIVKDLVGSFAQYLVADRFKNIDKMEKVKCPSLFIHGQQDKLIPFQHSIELMSKCQGLTQIALSETMTHNDFNMILDIILPIKAFFNKCELDIKRGTEFQVKVDPFNYQYKENLAIQKENEKQSIIEQLFHDD